MLYLNFSILLSKIIRSSGYPAQNKCFASYFLPNQEFGNERIFLIFSCSFSQISFLTSNLEKADQYEFLPLKPFQGVAGRMLALLISNTLNRIRSCAANNGITNRNQGNSKCDGCCHDKNKDIDFHFIGKTCQPFIHK